MVGEVEDGAAAVESAAALQPDVVVMDLNMPGLGGVEATRRIVAASPRVAVLVLTMHDDDSVFAAVRAWARGYLLRGADAAEISHVSNVFAKLHVADRAEAIVRARDAGLGRR